MFSLSMSLRNEFYKKFVEERWKVDRTQKLNFDENNLKTYGTKSTIRE